MKKIELFSFAKVGLYYPKKPEADICQEIIEVSLLTEIPIDGPDSSDLDKTIDDLLEKENEDFFSSQRYALRVQINLFLKTNFFNTFKIFFTCQYGLMRSPSVARLFKHWINLNYSGIPVSLTHLDIES